jgi:hypothetical protein
MNPMTPWPGIGPLQALYLDRTTQGKAHTFMPLAGFEPMGLVFTRSKTTSVLDPAATGTGKMNQYRL